MTASRDDLLRDNMNVSREDLLYNQVVRMLQNAEISIKDGPQTRLGELVDTGSVEGECLSKQVYDYAAGVDHVINFRLDVGRHDTPYKDILQHKYEEIEDSAERVIRKC